ncbi:MAG: nicotinate-nicotinamide nucleotide adenylyltransferase, partial [Gammaproteobacteria bacterium]
MIGVYGGSFDPVHEGHLGTASEAGEITGCDRVLMIPAALSPGKSAPKVSGQQRLEMLQLALADRPGLQVDGCEINREGPSYT